MNNKEILVFIFSANSKELREERIEQMKLKFGMSRLWEVIADWAEEEKRMSRLEFKSILHSLKLKKIL